MEYLLVSAVGAFIAVLIPTSDKAILYFLVISAGLLTIISVRLEEIYQELKKGK